MIEVTIENDMLVIKLPLQPGTPSESGRTAVVARTPGPVTTSAMHDGQHIIIDAVAYVVVGADERKEAARALMTQMAGIVKRTAARG